MPIRVVAAGRVAEVPSLLLGDDSWVVYVLDRFPGSPGVRLAHACEVVGRGQDMAPSPLGGVPRGDRVEVVGEVVMATLSGPLEDDLSGARVWIKATSVALADRTGAP